MSSHRYWGYILCIASIKFIISNWMIIICQIWPGTVALERTPPGTVKGQPGEVLNKNPPKFQTFKGFWGCWETLEILNLDGHGLPISRQVGLEGVWGRWKL